MRTQALTPRLVLMSALLSLPVAAQVGDPADLVAPSDSSPARVAPSAPPVDAPLPPATPQPPVDAPPSENAVDVDAALLAALLALETAFALEDESARLAATAAAIQHAAALDDERAVPAFVRLSRAANAQVRLAALHALGGLVRNPEARARLDETLLPTAPPEDAVVALPALLAASRAEARSAVPCPAGFTCANDGALLEALLSYSRAPDVDRPAAVRAVLDAGDPRALPFFLRLSRASPELRAPALDGLIAFARLPAARDRLLALLVEGDASDGPRVVEALQPLEDKLVTDNFLELRRQKAGGPGLQSALDVALRVRAPEELAAIVAEEERLLAELAGQPTPFDTTTRAAISAAAGLGAAVGAAAASSLVADEISQGSGACYGLWGACAGGASAAAIGWFGLGDARLTASDVGLAVSSSLMGAWAGLLIPPTVSQNIDDGRHLLYAGAAGQLVGLAAGSAIALAVDPTSQDIVELDVTVAVANLLAAGIVLSFPPGGDARPLWGALAGSTIVGAGLGTLAASRLTLDTPTFAHMAVLSGAGLLAGLSTGGALVRVPGRDAPTQVLAAGLLGAAAGTITAGTLGHFQLHPTTSGLVYEAWAAIDGGLFGLGTGFLLASLAAQQGPELPLGGAAIGIAGGALTTLALPDGVGMDVGDFILQPLFVGFSLYHSTALTATLVDDPRAVAASALLAPSLVSAGLVAAAPWINVSNGDVLMAAGLMGMGAYFSSMTLLSVDSRLPGSVPSWGYVLATSLAMDGGLAAAVALNFVPVDHLGWKVAYVTAVATGTTLVVSLPGSLLASGTNGAVAVTDVLIASSVAGLILGIATTPLIDFRVAPDWGLGKKHAQPARGEAAAVEVTPTALFVPPLKNESPPLAAGFVGRF